MIYTDEQLRLKVKQIKIMNNISYKKVANMIQIKPNSFYNWMNNSYSLSNSKKILLANILDNIKE